MDGGLPRTTKRPQPMALIMPIACFMCRNDANNNNKLHIIKRFKIFVTSIAQSQLQSRSLGQNPSRISLADWTTSRGGTHSGQHHRAQPQLMAKSGQTRRRGQDFKTGRLLESLSQFAASNHCSLLYGLWHFRCCFFWVSSYCQIHCDCDCIRSLVGTGVFFFCLYFIFSVLLLTTQSGKYISAWLID